MPYSDSNKVCRDLKFCAEFLNCVIASKHEAAAGLEVRRKHLKNGKLLGLL